ncbi:conjugal transfer protein TraH, partial [Azotobacter beijerinckii]
PIPRLIDKDALRLFVEGNDDTTTRVYDCASDDLDQCLEPGTRTLGTFKGLAAKIVDDLQQNQVLERFARNNATPSDGTRLDWLTRSHVGGHLLRIVQKNGAQAGYDYLGNYSRLLAADAITSFVIQLLDVTEQGLSSMTMADSVNALENLRDTRHRVMGEYRDLLLSYGGYKDADRQALDLLETAPNSDPGKLPQGTTASHAG